jgi:RNA polymerase sigma-70 factor, ECF subfamily
VYQWGEFFLASTRELFVWKNVEGVMYGRPWFVGPGRRSIVSIFSIFRARGPSRSGHKMSSPPNGRALALPVVWGASREVAVGPSPAEVRPPSDEELLSRLQNKDAKSLDLLFSRYSRLVFGIAFRILADHSEAEEVVQEAFFYVYRKALLFDPRKGSGKGWIVQIAFSRARDRKAHLSRRGFYSGTDIDSLDDTLIGKNDMEHEIEMRLDVSQLQCAFEDLTALQRQTLEMFYFEGLELREISERLGEPFGNVRHHFYRGLERLRKSPAVKRLRETHNA